MHDPLTHCLLTAAQISNYERFLTVGLHIPKILGEPCPTNEKNIDIAGVCWFCWFTLYLVSGGFTTVSGLKRKLPNETSYTQTGEKIRKLRRVYCILPKFMNFSTQAKRSDCVV